LKEKMGEKMNTNNLYNKNLNPLIERPARALPKTFAIIGAGTIGPDIGYYLKSAIPEGKLILVDVAEKSLKNAEERLNGYARKAVDRKKMSEENAARVTENIIYTTDYRQIVDCDLVIESATEDILLKQKIFSEVEKIVGTNTILTSNTSSIPADRIFAKMQHPERTTVTHFFAPAWRSLAVEVINWNRASKETIDYLLWMFAETGKAPVMTDNAICFMLDRIFDNWCNEAAYLLDQATAGQVCRVVEEFAFQGPLYVLNMGNGNPIIFETNSLQMEEGAHYKPSPMFPSVDRWLVPRPGTPVDVPEAVQKIVRDRMLGILFSQSFDIIDRGIGSKQDLNFGCQIALGFKKGPLDIMAQVGEKEVMRIMKRFGEDRPGFPQPTRPLDEYLDFKRHILVDEIDGVKIVTIRRPQSMNAISDEVNNEILSVLKAYTDDTDVKGFVITGYGNRAFSAGADIGRFPETLGNSEAAAQYARDCAQVQLFMDQMEKPVVAAINGMALGGGLEIAIRCHGIVALSNARFQFPEVTLGISPGIGGCVVPYRRWPEGAKLFHEMICLAKSIGVKEALEIGMVSKVVEDYPALIRAAVEEVNRLQGNLPRFTDESIGLPPIELPDQPRAGNLDLSREAVQILAETIRNGAAAQNFSDALEAGYQGAARIACTEAAKEGISAFLEKRKAVFKR